MGHFSVTSIIEMCTAVVREHAIMRSVSLPTHLLASPVTTSLLHLFSFLLPCLDYFKAKIRLRITLSISVTDVSSEGKDSKNVFFPSIGISPCR